MNDVKLALIFLASFTIAGVLQTCWLNNKYFYRWAKPLDGGFMWHNKPILGKNKTIAGFGGMVLFTTISFSFIGYFLDSEEVLISVSSVITSWPALGFCLGAAYMAAELPNSLIKRRLDIPPGQLPRSRWKWYLVLVDETDSVVGALMAASFLMPLSFKIAVMLFVSGTIIHWGFNLLLYLLKIKKVAV